MARGADCVNEHRLVKRLLKSEEERSKERQRERGRETLTGLIQQTFLIQRLHWAQVYISKLHCAALYRQDYWNKTR